MGRPSRKIEYQTRFQKWINPALEKRGIGLKALAALVDADYSHVWKIARGEPEKYPDSKRPGYELTEAIGKELNDLEGAMVAAEYWQIDPEGVARPTRPLSPDAEDEPPTQENEIRFVDGRFKLVWQADGPPLQPADLEFLENAFSNWVQYVEKKEPRLPARPEQPDTTEEAVEQK